MPELITTESVAVGIGCPPQVAVLFQLPETVAMRCAKREDPVITNKRTTMMQLKKRRCNIEADFIDFFYSLKIETDGLF
jgi:hypothetical protein